MRVKITNGQQRLGDALMMTCAIRDLKRQCPDWDIAVEVQGSVKAIWDNNPHIVPATGEFDKEVHIGTGFMTPASKVNGLHFTNSYRLSLQDESGKLNIPIIQGECFPEIFLTEEEKIRPFNFKYWVICTDHGASFSSKEWVPERWQEVVDALPGITFVQAGIQSFTKIRLTGKNVIDHVGRTGDFREYFRLIHGAEGVVGLVSGAMHTAAAFRKPCIVIAGAREPVTYEQYQNHRYLHNIGSLPCASVYACWSDKKGGCFWRYYKSLSSEKQVEMVPREEDRKSIKEYAGRQMTYVPKCLEMIKTQDVVNAVKSYYEGGRLLLDNKPKKMKLVMNGKYLGGAERSCVEIAKQYISKEYIVEVIVRGGNLSPQIIKAMPNDVIYSNDVSGKCDELILYASDMVFDFHLFEFDSFNRLQAQKKTMWLTYKIGKAATVPWARDWDKYMFLSSEFRDAYLGIVGSEYSNKSEVVPPKVDKTPFLDVKVDYDKKLTLIRHSSQGNSKYHRDTIDIVRDNPDVDFVFMPAPTWLPDFSNVRRFKENSMPVQEFLKLGNCFWYFLPDGYTEQGPRVIVEAMMCGLPVITENRGGMKDRVDEETGWLVVDHFYVNEVIRQIKEDPAILMKKGINSKNQGLLNGV